MKRLRLSLFLMFVLLGGCPRNSSPQPAPDATVDVPGADGDAWDEDWWKDVERPDFQDVEETYAHITEYSPAGGSYHRGQVPDIVIVFDMPMDPDSCNRCLNIFSSPQLGAVVPLSGEITWSASRTVLTFHPTAEVAAGSEVTVVLSNCGCRAFKEPDEQNTTFLADELFFTFFMDRQICWRHISMDPGQDATAAQGGSELYVRSDFLYVGTMFPAVELRTLLHMPLNTLEQQAPGIPPEKIEFAGLQLIDAEPWGNPPQDVVLEFLPYSETLSPAHFDMPAISAAFPRDPAGVVYVYPGYPQTGFVVTEAIRAAVGRGDAGVLMRISARDLVLDDQQNRVSYWAMGGPPYMEYWPNLSICIWEHWMAP